MSDLKFIHEILQKGGGAAALGGIVMLAMGLLLGRLGMVLGGAFLAFLGLADYVVMRLLRNRNSN